VAAPKMTRHEMKQDELVTAVEKAGDYLSTHPERLRNTTIAVVAVLVVAFAGYYWFSSRAAGAADMLREAQARFSAPVGADAAGAGRASYATAAERDRAALETFSKLASDYGGRSEGRLALYYQGVLLARLGRKEEAETALNGFIANPTSPTIAAMARAQLAQVKAMRGDLDGAAKIFSEMAEDASASYPRDWALFYMAQMLDQAGKKAEAAAAYRKISTEFPGSPLAAEAGKLAGGAGPAS
jgi:TolA-binding protein